MGKLGEISAWNLTKVRSKKQVIDEARTKGATVHLKNAEMEASTKSTKDWLCSEAIL